MNITTPSNWPEEAQADPVVEAFTDLVLLSEVLEANRFLLDDLNLAVEIAQQKSLQITYSRTPEGDSCMMFRNYSETDDYSFEFYTSTTVPNQVRIRLNTSSGSGSESELITVSKTDDGDIIAEGINIYNNPIDQKAMIKVINELQSVTQQVLEAKK